MSKKDSVTEVIYLCFLGVPSAVIALNGFSFVLHATGIDSFCDSVLMTLFRDTCERMVLEGRFVSWPVAIGLFIVGWIVCFFVAGILQLTKERD